MRCLFGNRYILKLFLKDFIRPIFLADLELPMQDKYLKASIFVQKYQAAFLSRKTAPNNVIQIELSNKGIVEFSIVIEPHFIFKC